LLHYEKEKKEEENLRSIAFMDFSWVKIVDIYERTKRMTVCFAGEKKIRQLKELDEKYSRRLQMQTKV